MITTSLCLPITFIALSYPELPYRFEIILGFLLGVRICYRFGISCKGRRICISPCNASISAATVLLLFLRVSILRWETLIFFIYPFDYKRSHLRMLPGILIIAEDTRWSIATSRGRDPRVVVWWDLAISRSERADSSLRRWKSIRGTRRALNHVLCHGFQSLIWLHL